MALNKKIFLIGFIITLLLFISIILSNSIMNSKREETVIGRMDQMIEEYEDMQTLLFMSEFFGEEATCIALQSMLASMNKEVWKLGSQLDSYRQVTEEFMQDPFYQNQKRIFNRKEVLYFSVLKKMKNMCNLNQTIVSFFFRKKDFCDDCDAQSFVLSDLKHDLEQMEKDEELPMFSFDVDTDLPSINLLIKFYNITHYPCIVIEDEPFCGLHSKKELTGLLCKESALSICP